jgi:hypothetical protein
VGEKGALVITKSSKGLAQENLNGNGDFNYTLLPADESDAIIEILNDSSHNFCMSTNTNVKVGLKQKSTYKYSMHTALANGDTSLFYIDCFKPIYMVISTENIVNCKLVVTNHSFGDIKDTVDIAIIR